MQVSLLFPRAWWPCVSHSDSTPFAGRILAVGFSAAVIACWLSSDAVAKPGWGDCTTCHGPALSTTPGDGSTLDFGNALVGESVDRTFSITNTGGNSGGRSIRLSGNFPASTAEFILNGAVHFSNLSRNSSQNRTYSYVPVDRGVDSQDMTSTADDSSDGWPVSQGSSTVTFTGHGVAPVSEIDSSQLNAGNIRIGTSANSQIMVRNVGDGNLSNLGSPSNLKGDAGAGSGAFVGLGGSIDLADGADVTFQYGFTPVAHGPQSSAIELAFSNGSPDGANQAHSANVELLGVGVGPEFDSSPAPDSVVNFGEVASGETSLQSLSVNNLSPDGNLADSTSLTLLSAIITGPNADLFSVSEFTPGTVLSASETLSVGLLFDPQDQAGGFQAMLSLTTDQNSAFGTLGRQYTYQLTGSTVASVLGDFNLNGQLDVDDMDMLTAEVILATNNPFYDVNSDALVNQTDRRVWVEQLKKTWFGDANVDSEFNSADMVSVFAAGKYETGEPVGWAKGDWDGDGFFTSGDMVAAFVDGGYEKGQRPAAMAAVPEPGTATLLFVPMALLTLACRRRRSLA